MLIRVLWSLAAISIAALHYFRPALTPDEVTLVWLGIALIPWLAQILKSLEVSGIGKVEFRELEAATRDQAKAALDQTLATVINWVQAPDIRESRHVLFTQEDSEGISRLPAKQWQDHWKQAADRVVQAFNSAAIIAQQDERLQEVWIRPTRRSILKTSRIVQPRIHERRQDQHDLWQHFDWLVDKARTFSTPEEQRAWTGGPA